MSKTKRWILGGGIAIMILVAVFFLTAALLVRQSLLKAGTPIYDYKSVPSEHEGYSHQTLTIENHTYESDYAEYGLSAAGTDFQVGQTSLGGRIYEIDTQRNYLVVYDFMSPIGVFRDSQIPPFDWRTTDFNEMRLYSTEIATATPQEPKTSTDVQLIQAALAPMRRDSEPISPSQLSGGYKSFVLYLYSEQLTGMSYSIGVYMDDTGAVYVAENTLSKEWFPASELFSKWVAGL